MSGQPPTLTDGVLATHEVAARLREEILQRRDAGAFLGSELEVQKRLGVSRPTLRQALRILEHENLVITRRGVGGGLFARAPSPRAVSHIASVYLRYQGTTARELNRADAVIVPEIARLAARNPSLERRSSLAELANAPAHRARVSTLGSLRDAWRDFGLQLIAVIENPPLALFYEMMLDLSGDPFPLDGIDRPERRERVIHFHRELADAVRRGADEEAAEIAATYFEETVTWTDDETEGSQFHTMTSPQPTSGRRNRTSD